MESYEYWRIYKAVADMMHEFGLIGTDKFLSECVNRVAQDADTNWNEDDVRIAIRNMLNEMIEKL